MEDVFRERGASMARLESPDELLVVAAILGNLEAFEELVLRYRPAVVRLARTIVGINYAEDVAQESLLLAFKALPSIEEPGKFAAWLSAITRHRALRFNKRESMQVAKLVALDEVLIEKIEALTKPLTDKTENEELIGAIDSLPSEYALPLRLRFLDEMPLKRIAAFMGVPLSTVKWRLHHGKELLRAKVEVTN
jgi:RNA polymerase sigma-70 factor, ECF subfamily